MSKKSIRIISTVLTIAVVLMTLTSTAFAFEPSNVQPNETKLDKVESMGNQIVGVIRTVGIFVSVGILMVLGIKYMMGSAEEKASYKKTMMPYLIGAVLLFGASTIAGAIFNYMK